MSYHCPFCRSTETHGVYDNASLCSKNLNLNPCDPCKRLAELEIQIIKARETLLEMQREAQRLKSEMNYNHDHLIHRLPPEISSDIFQLCIPREMAGFAPVTLSSVCQKWRQIAHATPQLWTTIVFSDGLQYHDELSVSRLVQEWIDRSGQLPLSIVLFVKLKDGSCYVNQDVIAVINQCSSRWRDLIYEGSPYSLRYLVGDSQGASQLQNLKLHVGVAHWPFKLGDFKPAPTTLEIAGFDLKSVVIEWNNITHMQASPIYVDDCWELFRIAPRMTHCVLRGVLESKARNPFPRPNTPILHPTLQALELSIRSDVFDLFHKNVSLPSLQSYTCDVHGDRLETESLISLFLRSSCSLQTLALSDVKLDVADLVKLSRVTPDLRHLGLASYYRYPGITESIFHRFSNASIITSTDSETNHALFPQLQSITYNGALPRPRDWKLVPDIFGSPSDVHNTHRRPLRSLTLSSPLVSRQKNDLIIDKDTLSRMLSLVARGIKLKIEQENPRVDVLQQSIEFHADDSVLGESRRGSHT
ncbi:hypothetical protein BDZ97DRAFT_187768 [Flammula alnicola]|nr:hypothetical protein BDZ97DRAFT_187768 [Flammula alnicola]